MDHTSSLWVKPSNMRCDCGIAAVLDVAMVRKLDVEEETGREIDEMRDKDLSKGNDIDP
jgi:hypothetical protein